MSEQLDEGGESACYAHLLDDDGRLTEASPPEAAAAEPASADQ